MALLVLIVFFSPLPKDPPYCEDMSKEQLQQEIKKELEEIGKRDEVFVIIIDAINQVIVTSKYVFCRLECPYSRRARAAFSSPSSHPGYTDRLQAIK